MSYFFVTKYHFANSSENLNILKRNWVKSNSLSSTKVTWKSSMYAAYQLVGQNQNVTCFGNQKRGHKNCHLMICVSYITVFENRGKSLIHNCERSELRLRGQKFIQNGKNGQFWRIFLGKACCQTVFPDNVRSSPV